MRRNSVEQLESLNDSKMMDIASPKAANLKRNLSSMRKTPFIEGSLEQKLALFSEIKQDSISKEDKRNLRATLLSQINKSSLSNLKT